MKNYRIKNRKIIIFKYFILFFFCYKFQLLIYIIYFEKITLNIQKINLTKGICHD